MLKGAPESLTDQKVAEWILETAVAPEAANQGLWYSASVIAVFEVRLRRPVADQQYADELVHRYINRLRSTVAAWPDGWSAVPPTQRSGASGELLTAEHYVAASVVGVGGR
jgi:hypothetical protein